MHITNFKNKKILLISDTYGKHRILNIPKDINIIVHCGDICTDVNIQEFSDFLEWYSKLEIPYKIFVNGKHDLIFELEPENAKKIIPKNVIWLNDESICIDGITLKGLSPFFYFQNFNAEENIDVLISHYPPLGILDDGSGSVELRDFVIKSKPKYCVFGHNHKVQKFVEIDDITFINASLYEDLFS
mgnify:CR=1 FL=1